MKNVTPETSITLVTPEQIARFVRKKRENPEKYGEVCLLLGAGCSLEAGIPLADTIVGDVCREYAEDINIVCRDKERTYKNCMMALEPAEREIVIRRYIENSKINWANLYAAALMKEKFIKRVYTVNFDPVFIKAAAVQGLYPAVYDLAVQRYQPHAVMDPSIFYLHGQGSGFLQIHDGEKQSGKSDESDGGYTARLNELFAAEADCHMWIVVGYSGDNDPVFKSFIANASGRHKIFWVRHDDNNPCDEVMDGLMKLQDSSRFLCKNNGADNFFRDVANELDISLPEIIEEPFQHLLNLSKDIKPYPWKEEGRRDPVAFFRDRVEKAHHKFPATPEAQAVASLAEGKPENVSNEDPETKAWALFDEAYKLQQEVDVAEGITSKRRLLKEVCKIYGKAIELKQDMYQAHHNWGNALGFLAGTEHDPARKEKYLTVACERFREATLLKPDTDKSFLNWGITLTALEDIDNSTKNKQRYLSLACKQFKAATNINPSNFEAYNSWGTVLCRLAILSENENEKTLLFNQAQEKCLKAEGLKSGSGAYNLACIAALHQKPDVAIAWLEKSKEHGSLPDVAHLDSDPDLDPIRETMEYKAFRASLEKPGDGSEAA